MRKGGTRELIQSARIHGSFEVDDLAHRRPVVDPAPALEFRLAGDAEPLNPGLQPCPTCLGGLCTSGANAGGGCTPGNTNLGSRGPTSHDCPPLVGLSIGSIPIAYALTTGVASDTAFPTAAQLRVFCGYCRDADATLGHGLCAGGLNPGFPCAQQTDCPGGTCGGEIPCTSDADCSQPREGCAQRNPGAFAFGTARTITATGTPAGACLDDGLAHAATLVSVFCIPPSFDGTVDSAADLPGPGAVALPGMMQLSP